MNMKPVAVVCGFWIAASGTAGAQTAGGQAPSVLPPLGQESLMAPSAAAKPAPQPVAQPVVIELFTSQGCASCPPADALFSLLAKDPDIIPLSLHVDYWDYIGWADNFAQPSFTDRQKDYARAEGSRTIYTPQMIVSGAIRVEGNNADALAEAIEREKASALSEPPVAELSVTREAGGLRIRASAPVTTTAPGSGWRVQLVRYIPEQTIDITHGENAGQRVSYRNIVTDWQRITDWPGQPPLDLLTPFTGEDPGVVVLQREGPGEIVAAARVE